MDFKLLHKSKNRARLKLISKTALPFGLLQRNLEARGGIKSVRINEHIASMVVEYDEGKIAFEQIEDFLKSYKETKTKEESESGTPIPLLRPLSALALTPILSSFANMIYTTFASLPALGSGAKYLFTKGVTSEVLEAMAIAISIYRKDFFAANTTNLLIELAEHIEDKIERKSESMLKSLLKPSVEQVWVLKYGQEVLLDASEVQVGDIVIAGSGATIAVDGTVSEGEALVNEVSLTGESTPVQKSRGDRVISGTIVQEGRIGIWAECVGNDTVTFRISEYVRSSLQTKSQSQIEANKLADNLVPLTLGLGALSYIASRDITRVASVFQADYSCALKLTTPVSFQASMYQAGLHGVLIKGADALERLSSADTFVFDKTGTLTSGNLEVADVFSLDSSWNKEEILSLAASIEEHYFHPLAEAVVKAAQECHSCRHFHHSKVEFIVAHGVSAVVTDKKVVIGSRHFLEDDEGICFDSQYDFIDEQYKKGHTLLYIGYDGKLLGIISLKDSLRNETKATLERLRSLGVQKIVMLTGDHRERARDMADSLGIDDYRYELLPQDKASIIEELKSSGHKVVFVGDGINDAPALSGASVGIAMQKGADIARVSADIALLEDRLSAVADAKEIANKAMKLIDNNFKITVGANSAILGAAAFGLLTPVTTSILHNGTTVAILLNAMRGAKI